MDKTISKYMYASPLRIVVVLAIILGCIVFALNGSMAQSATITVNPGDSIQTAINNATPGDTISVAAGFYAGSININKALTLDGDGAVSTSITGEITVSANDVTISDFTITNPSGKHGITAQDRSNLTITNNIVTGIGSADASTTGTNYGIAITSSAAAVDGITITGNQINNIAGGNKKSADGIALGWSNGAYDITNALIQNNTISGITSDISDFGLGGRGANGILINHGTGVTGKTVAPQILDNNISNMEGLWVHGIGLEGNTPNALVQGNTVDNLVDHKSPADPDAAAIMVEDNASANTVIISGNSFTDVLLGVRNATALAVNAGNNWWGDADPDDNVYNTGGGSVDYSPWLKLATGSIPMTWGTNDSIQDAVTASSAGDTINVTAGTYAGAEVNKSVTIAGDPGAIINDGPVFTTGCGGVNKLVGFRLAYDGSASGTTISGLTFDNVDFPIYSRHNDNVTLSNNNMLNSNQAVTSWDGDNWNVSNNTITDLRADNGGGIGVILGARYGSANSGNVIDSNQVSGTVHVSACDGGGYDASGLVLFVDFRYGWPGGSMSNNTISHNSVSLTSDNPGLVSAAGIELSEAGNPGSPGVIHDNTVVNNTVSNTPWGIRLQGASNNSIYHNNFVNNTTQALTSDGAAGNSFNEAGPVGGNYWSDWTTPDADSDGFVDSPYVFSGGQDDLPWATSISPKVTYLAPTAVINTGSPIVTATAVAGGSSLLSAEVGVAGGDPAHPWDYNMYTFSCTIGLDGAVSCPTSGLPEGEYTATVTVMDVDHQIANATGNFTIVDDAAPVTTDDTDSNWHNHSVTVTLSCTDLVSGCASTTWSADTGGGGTFTGPGGGSFVISAEGVTTITYSSTDNLGHVETPKTAQVKIDTIAPAVTTSGDVTVEATGPSGATASFTMNATDAVGVVSSGCTPVSGSTFAIGTTVVNCTATDAAGNTGSASLTVTVVDTTAPAVTTSGDVTVEATGPSGATASFTMNATDAVGVVSSGCTPVSGSTFAIGTTVVNCTATDAAGNTGSASLTVTVVDTTAPAVTYTGPTGTVYSYVGSITATASDIASNLQTATLSLNGGSSTACTITGGNIDCPVTLVNGAYSAVISVTDQAGNTGTTTGSFIYAAHGQPNLSLSVTGVYWATYPDYLARSLSVNYRLTNSPSGPDAIGVMIEGSTNTNSVVLLTATPAGVGDIAAGGNAGATLKYSLPAGVASFKTSIYATASDPHGDSYAYPGPYPGA